MTWMPITLDFWAANVKNAIRGFQSHFNGNRTWNNEKVWALVCSRLFQETYRKVISWADFCCYCWCCCCCTFAQLYFIFLRLRFVCRIKTLSMEWLLLSSSFAAFAFITIDSHFLLAWKVRFVAKSIVNSGLGRFAENRFRFAVDYCWFFSSLFLLTQCWIERIWILGHQYRSFSL